MFVRFISIMKNIQTILLIGLLTLAAFGQEPVPATTADDSAEKPVGESTKLVHRFDFNNPSERVFLHRFLDNGTKLWMLGTDTLQIWDIRNKSVISSERHEVYNLEEKYLAISPDNSRVLLRSDPIKDKDISAALKAGDRSVITGDMMVTGENNDKVYRKAFVADLNSKKEVIAFNDLVISGHWSKDGSTLVTQNFDDNFYMDGKEDAVLNFYDSADMKLRSTISVKDLVWTYLSPDGSLLYTASNSDRSGWFGLTFNNGMASVVNIWNTRTGKVEKSLSVGSDYAALTWKMYPSPRGTYMAMVAKHKTKDAEHKVVVWKMDGSDKPAYTLEAAPRIRDSQISYSPDEEYFALDAGKNVQIYHAATGKFKIELKDIELPKYWMEDNSIVMDPYTRRMGVIDTVSGNKLYDLPLHYRTEERTTGSTTDANGNTTDTTTSVVVDYTRFARHPEGKAYVAYSNLYVKVIDARTGEHLAVVVHPPFIFTKSRSWDSARDLVSNAGWSDDGKMLWVIESSRRGITLWDFERK